MYNYFQLTFTVMPDETTLFYLFSASAQVMGAFIALGAVMVVYYHQGSVQRFFSYTHHIHHYINNREELYKAHKNDWNYHPNKSGDFKITHELRIAIDGQSEERVIEVFNELLTSSKATHSANEYRMLKRYIAPLNGLIQLRFSIRRDFFRALAPGLVGIAIALLGIWFTNSLSQCPTKLIIVILLFAVAIVSSMFFLVRTYRGSMRLSEMDSLKKASIRLNEQLNKS